MNKLELMGHIIAGYPDKQTSIQAGMGISKGGAKYLEIQFPFSDPSADGVVIEKACSEALKNGFKIKDGFECVRYLSHQTSTEILIMTYGNIIFKYGVQNFIKKAKECGAKALIVPDLPFECDEGLRKIAKKFHLDVIELITPRMESSRIEKLSEISNEFVYVVARTGTTGSQTQIEPSLFEWINFVKKHCDKKIALGFGINSNEQVKALQDKVDIIVAGSYFVQKISQKSKNTPSDFRIHTTQLDLQMHTKNLISI